MPSPPLPAKERSELKNVAVMMGSKKVSTTSIPSIGLASSWTEVVKANVEDMLKYSDHPAELKDNLLNMLASKDRQSAMTLLHIGYKEARDGRQNAWINMGVVAALVFSVLFSAINQPFGIIQADDMWSSHRETMNKVLICMLYISTIFGLITVILTIFLLIHLGSFVSDADDYIYFMQLNPHGLVDVSIVITLLCGGVSIPLAAVVSNEEPIASFCFFLSMATFLGVVIIYVRSVVCNSKRRQKRVAEVASQEDQLALIVKKAYDSLLSATE